MATSSYVVRVDTRAGLRKSYSFDTLGRSLSFRSRV